MSAALVLGRSLRRTLVFDHGDPRNLAADHAHNLFTRDGTPPVALHEIARRQLATYGVEQRNVAVETIEPVEGGFRVVDAGGIVHRARRVLLATGVRDDVPDWPGFERFWGQSVFHCPYCHGWESRGQRIAVLGDRGEKEAMAAVEIMRGWTDDLVLCTDGEVELGDGVRDLLALLRVEVNERRIRALHGRDALEGIEFDDGTRMPCGGMYLHPPQHVRGGLIADLGCRLENTGLVEVGADHQTTVAGVYAAGDMVSTLQQVVTAAASGTAAAISLNRALLADDFATAVATAPVGATIA